MTKPASIRPQEGKQELALNLKVDILIFGGAAGCVSAETEYLSPEGWRNIDSYDGGLVGAYDSQTDLVTLETPSEYIKQPCQQLTHIKARGIDQTLSDEHKVVYWHTKGYGPKTLPFHEVERRHDKSLTKGWTGRFKTSFKVARKGLDATEGELRLQVAVMADGRVVKEGANNYTQMRFSKQSKYLRLLALCEKWGLRYKDNGCKENLKYSNNTEYEVIVWPKWSDKSYSDKYWSCTQEQLAFIVDEVGYWDGSLIENKKSNTIRYFSKNKSDSDFIQYAFHSQNLNTSITEDFRKDKYTNSHYTVNGSTTGGGFRCLANKDSKAVFNKVPTTDGYKYCFIVSTGMLLLRSNGCIFVTGNSGKSRLLLMKPLPYLDDPNFNAIFFRRTTKALEKPGSLWPEATKLYAPFKPRIRERDHKQTFASGSTVVMDHLEHESNAEGNHQGTQYSMVGFDELTHFTNYMFIYLIGRLRSEAKVDSFIVATCNPDPDSWVLNWVEWYLDEEGYPDPDKCGVIRYFVIEDETPIFADTAEELEKSHPHLCTDLNKNTGEVINTPPKTFAFIGGTIYDNPALIKSNPGYFSSLKAQTKVNRARLLDGNWYARPEGSSNFRREWLIKENKLPKSYISARAWDKASSVPSDINRYPDFTACTKMLKTPEGRYYIVGDFAPDTKVDASSKGLSKDVYGKFQKRPGERNAAIEEQGRHDGEDCVVVLPKDPGAAGKIEFEEASKQLLAYGAREGLYLKVKQDPMPGTKSKMTRYSPFSSACENGLVSIIESTFPNKETLDAFYKENESFNGERSTSERKDDWADSSASAFNYLAAQSNYGIVLRNQTGSNTFAQPLLTERIGV